MMTTSGETPRSRTRGPRLRWPELRLNLHLHDTRGLGIANAYAGLEMGVDSFDAAVAGLGGSGGPPPRAGSGGSG